MPPQRIQYREEDMRTMIDVLRKSSGQLKEVRGQMQSVSKQISDGALLGNSGTQFSQSINSSLFNSIDRMCNKLDERANYVERELQELLNVAQQTSKRQYQ